MRRNQFCWKANNKENLTKILLEILRTSNGEFTMNLEV
jgi:hypothetical protein